MSANGISDPSKTKEARQLEKLQYSEARRKGQTITEGGGSWSTDGVDDPTAGSWRERNDLDFSQIPNPYEGNAVNLDDDENTDPLVPGRPWAEGETPANALRDRNDEPLLDRAGDFIVVGR